MMKMVIRLIFIGVILLTTMLVSPKIEAAPASAPAALPAQQTNLLQNPGFEMPYNSDGAASNWVRWHRNSSEDKFDDCTNGYHKLPKWSPETVSSGLIHSGAVSQHVGNQWDTWAAGVWQNVNVTPGSTYRFTVHAYGRGSNEVYPAPSEGGLQMNVRVGIDPNGSGLWSDGDVVWSGTINPHSTWQTVSVEATATGSTMTVFTAADWGVQGVNQCRKHLDVWFDTAELIEVGPPPTNTPVPQPTSPPPPPPPATNTPVPPAATDTPDVPPTATAVPPTEEPTAVPGATVCLNAFADVNGNGVKDANEGYMGNVAFTIGRNNQVVGQAVSSGTSTPFCFDGLEPGVYEVAQIVPGALEMTTAGNASVEVAEGQTVGVEFGSRVRLDEPAPATTEVASVDQPTAVPAAEQPAAAGFSLAAISGLVVMLLAVVLLGGLIFVVLRRTGA